MFNIASIQHAGTERGPFYIDRNQGFVGYTFLHFYGSIDIWVNGEVITTRPHACFLYAPGSKQYYGSENDIAHDWFHFFTDTPLPEELLCDTIYYPSDPAVVSAIIQELSNEYYSDKRHKQELIELKSQELFLKLVRSSNYEDTPSVSHLQKKNFSALRTYIFSHLGERWTVEKMATRANLSVSHFHSLYHTLYGKSPMDDLILARCISAHVALVHSDTAISAIAKKLGYSSVSHFIRQFRSIYNITPGELRKKVANDDDNVLWYVPHMKSNDSSAMTIFTAQKRKSEK